MVESARDSGFLPPEEDNNVVSCDRTTYTGSYEKEGDGTEGKPCIRREALEESDIVDIKINNTCYLFTYLLRLFPTALIQFIYVELSTFYLSY